MNRTEAASVVAYLNRAGLLGAMEGQAAVWADALEDVSYVTAQQVVRAMARERTSDQRWVTPGDLAAAVRAERKRNVDRMASPQPPDALAGHPGREQEWTQAYVRLIGDGLEPAEATEAACAHLGVSVPAPVQIAARPHDLRLPTGRQCRCSPPCIEGHVRREEGAA